jgi:sacsin
MATPKEHIEEIRTTKFSIGGNPNPLTEDLHHAVRNLSAELYAKDVHFLMELVQVHFLFHIFLFVSIYNQ